MAIVNNLFTDNLKILQSEASKAAYQGVGIAVAAIFIATSLVCYMQTGTLSFEGLWAAQKNNVALWVLNVIPFIFGIWGQYSSSMIAYQAGAIIVDQTQALRIRADSLEKQTTYVSTHDRLTDLPNRALFYDRVEQSIIGSMQCSTSRGSMALLLVEIDNFKEIYDTLGRNSCDLIIKQVSTRILGLCAERDIVARIDSNVFAVLLADNAHSVRAEEFSLHIQKSLESPFSVGRLQVGVHPNVGIVFFPDHGGDVDTLVQRAGVALHMAQTSNKGFAFYEQSFDKHTPLKLTLMSELRHAIDSDGLDLFYQPQVHINSQQIYGAEALLRWNHPTHGFISPDDFIPMAERNRMIKPITQWVLRRAFRDCAQWRSQGVPIKVSINLSARDLHDPELPDLISSIALLTGIQPSWIILEITESSVMTDPESALENIKRLNSMGYHFAMDDFGTGYSSLAYLKKMPLSELKIDKSFVMDILANENDSTIVKATINLAHNLGLKITAEGVENQAILDLLAEYGCDVAQGYFLSKPLSVPAFNEWLAKSSWRLPDLINTAQ